MEEKLRSMQMRLPINGIYISDGENIFTSENGTIEDFLKKNILSCENKEQGN